MIRCNLTQGSPEWLAWRSEGIGSSEVSVLLDLNPYCTKWAFWAKRKFSILDDLSSNPLVKDGKKFEPLVRQKLEKHFGKVIEVFCAYNAIFPHRRASFDGVMDGNIPTEIKVVSDPVWDEVTKVGSKSEAYEMYYPQVCYQMGILESDIGYLVFYNRTSNQIRLFKIVRDVAVDDFIDEINEVVDAFFEKSILNNEEPEKDPRRDDYIPDESEMHDANELAYEFFNVVKAEQEAKHVHSQLKEKRDALAQKLSNIAITFKSINLFGVRITKRKRTYRIDYEAFLKDKGIQMTEDERIKYSSLSKESLSLNPAQKFIPQLKDKVMQQRALEAQRSFKLNKSN